MKDRIVLLGATGTVGAYAAIELQRNGYEVLAVGRRESDNGFFGEHGMQYLSLDITDKEAFKVLPQENVYAVVHFAVTGLVGGCRYNGSLALGSAGRCSDCQRASAGYLDEISSAYVLVVFHCC